MNGRRAVLAVALVALAGLGALLAAPALGSDNVTILEVEPENASAPPGETLHVEVRMISDGGYGPVGVERVAFDVEYDETVLTAEEIHRGPWMEQGNETEIVTETSIDDDEGVASIEQVRDPAAGGATGNGRIAVVTFAVAEDADGAESPVEIDGVEVDLTNDWPQEAFLHNGTVTVDADADVVGAEPPATAESDSNALSGPGPLGALAAATAAFAVVAALARVRSGSESP